MEKLIKNCRGKGFETYSREFIQDSPLSMEARFLLIYMQSMPENWKFKKTHLYTCFPKNKRTVITRVWKELEEEGYILSFRKRVKGQYMYCYYYELEGFTNKEVQMYIASAEENRYEVISAESAEQNNKKETFPQPLDNTGFSTTVEYQQWNIHSGESTDLKINKKRLNNKEQSDTVSDTRTCVNDSIHPVEISLASSLKTKEKKTSEKQIAEKSIQKNELDAFEKELERHSLLNAHNPFLTDRTLNVLALFEGLKQEVGVAKKIKDLIFQTKRSAEKKATEERIPKEAIAAGIANPIKIHLSNENGMSKELENCVVRTMAAIRQAEKKGKPIKNEIGYWNHALANFWNTALIAWVDFNCDFLPENSEYTNRTDEFRVIDHFERETIHVQPMEEQVRFFFVMWNRENQNVQSVGASNWDDARTYIRDNISNFDGFSDENFQKALQDSRWRDTLGSNI